MAVNTVKNNIAYGLNNALQSLSPLPIIAKREPSSSDIGELGQYWIYNDQVWMFTSQGTWTELAAAGNSGVFTSLTVNGDSDFNGAIQADTGDEAIILNSGTGDIEIGADSVAKDITIGNITGASSLTLLSGSGDIVLDANSTGNIQLIPGSVSGASTTVTNDSLIGSTTITGLTTASAASFTVTMTNTNVTTSSAVIVTASNLNASTNGANIAVKGVVTAANTIIITVVNNGSGALGAGDNVHIGHIVLN